MVRCLVVFEPTLVNDMPSGSSQAIWLSFSVDQPCSSLFYFFGAKSSPLAFVALTKKLKMHSAYSKMHPFTSVHNLHLCALYDYNIFFFFKSNRLAGTAISRRAGASTLSQLMAANKIFHTANVWRILSRENIQTWLMNSLQSILQEEAIGSAPQLPREPRRRNRPCDV